MRSALALTPTGLLREEFVLHAMQGTYKSVKAFVNAAALAKQSTAIAVSDLYNNVVDIYDPEGNHLAQLTGFNEPTGLASNSMGDLYVADQGNKRVQIYASGFKTPPATLCDVGYPGDVDSFGNGQIVAVCNEFSTDHGPGNVDFFTNGRLTNSVSCPTLQTILDCSFDAFGNLYVVGFAPNDVAVRVGRIIGGAQGTEITLLTTSATRSSSVIAPLIGLQVTTTGQIAIGAYCDGHNAVLTYDPPVGNSLGCPVFATPLMESEFPVGFAFTKNMDSLYTADFHNGEAQQYAYPTGGKALSTIDVGGGPFGVAVISKQYPALHKAGRRNSR